METPIHIVSSKRIEIEFKDTSQFKYDLSYKSSGKNTTITRKKMRSIPM